MTTRSEQQSSPLYPQHPQFGPPSVVPVPLFLELPTNTGNCYSDAGTATGIAPGTTAELSSISQDPLPSPACPFD